MRINKIVISLFLVLIACSAFTYKKTKGEVYAFGVSASFTDTIVYYTEIQLIDSVSLDKNGFLPQRELYSYQLKNFLEYKKGLPNRTCMIYFADSKKKIDSEIANILAKYKKNESITLVRIEPTEFTFKKPSE